MASRISLEEQARALIDQTVSSDEDEYPEVKNFSNSNLNFPSVLTHQSPPNQKQIYRAPSYQMQQQQLQSPTQVHFKHERSNTPSSKRKKSTMKSSIISGKKGYQAPKLNCREANRAMKNQVNQLEGTIKFLQQEYEKANQMNFEKQSVLENQQQVIVELRDENQLLLIKQQDLLAQLKEQSSISRRALNSIQSLQSTMDSTVQRNVIEKEQMRVDIELHFEKKLAERQQVKVQQLQTELRLELSRKYESVIQTLEINLGEKNREIDILNHKIALYLDQQSNIIQKQEQQDVSPSAFQGSQSRMMSMQLSRSPNLQLSRSPKKVYFSDDVNNVSSKQQLLSNELKMLNQRLRDIKQNKSLY